MLNMRTIDNIIRDIVLPIKMLFLLNNKIINLTEIAFDETINFSDIQDEFKMIEDDITSIDKQMSELYH